MKDEQDIVKFLPPLLAQIARLTSLDVALKIAEVWGGASVYFPKCRTANNKLADLVGAENARKIGEAIGGEERVIPTMTAPGMKKVTILQSTEPPHVVAKKLGCTARHVRRVRAECEGPRRVVNGRAVSAYEERILAAKGTPEEVAAELGCSVAAVRAIRGVLGVEDGNG